MAAVIALAIVAMICTMAAAVTCYCVRRISQENLERERLSHQKDMEELRLRRDSADHERYMEIEKDRRAAIPPSEQELRTREAEANANAARLNASAEEYRLAQIERMQVQRGYR